MSSVNGLPRESLADVLARRNRAKADGSVGERKLSNSGRCEGQGVMRSAVTGGGIQPKAYGILRSAGQQMPQEGSWSSDRPTTLTPHAETRGTGPLGVTQDTTSGRRRRIAEAYPVDKTSSASQRALSNERLGAPTPTNLPKSQQLQWEQAWAARQDRRQELRGADYNRHTRVGALGMNRSEQLQQQFDMDLALTHQRSEAEWAQVMSPEEFDTMRGKGCEQPGSGAHWKQWARGVYTCKASNRPVFLSSHKFEAGNGFANFFDHVPGALKIVDTVDTRQWPDAGVDSRYSNSAWSYDTARERPCQEVYDAETMSFLGYRFEGEGYNTTTNVRFIINSAALDFTPADDEPVNMPATCLQNFRSSHPTTAKLQLPKHLQ